MLAEANRPDRETHPVAGGLLLTQGSDDCKQSIR